MTPRKQNSKHGTWKQIPEFKFCINSHPFRAYPVRGNHSFSSRFLVWKHQSKVSSTQLVQSPSPGTSPILHSHLKRWWMATLSLSEGKRTLYACSICSRLCMTRYVQSSTSLPSGTLKKTLVPLPRHCPRLMVSQQAFNKLQSPLVGSAWEKSVFPIASLTRVPE